MENIESDVNRELMLDGNALGGLLNQIFGGEMTAVPAECATCTTVSQVGAMWAFTQAPGAVLRCPACENVMLRIVETPDAIYLDARGAAYFRFAK